METRSRTAMDQPKKATKSAAVLDASMTAGAHRIAVPDATFLIVALLPSASVITTSPAVPTQIPMGEGAIAAPGVTDTQDFAVSAFSNE